MTTTKTSLLEHNMKAAKPAQEAFCNVRFSVTEHSIRNLTSRRFKLSLHTFLHHATGLPCISIAALADPVSSFSQVCR